MLLPLPLDLGTLQATGVQGRFLLSGTLYTARDAAHQRLIRLLDDGQALPLSLKKACLFYAGPTPPHPNGLPGACGPTTASRLDPYCERLLAQGVSCVIGKGQRSLAIMKAFKRYQAVYLQAIGGAGALLAQSIKKMELIAFADLGPEAIYRLDVEQLPVWFTDNI